MMARLIDADKRIAEIKKQYCTDCENYGGVKCRACWVDDAMCLIDDATTVDAVEVVRCKDCKYWGQDVCSYTGDDESFCTNPDGLDNYAHPDDFCSYGERRTDG